MITNFSRKHVLDDNLTVIGEIQESPFSLYPNISQLSFGTSPLKEVRQPKVMGMESQMTFHIHGHLQDESGHTFRQSTPTSYVKNIVLPGTGKLRARTVVSRSRARSTGKYPSWKMQRMIQFESRNELNAFILLDCDPHVSNFSEQPCEIQYVVDGITKRHYPDILVEIDGHKELWEVKPESKAFEPDISARTALLVEALPAWGYAYRVVLDKELAMQPRLSNADKLLRLGRCTITDCERESIRIALMRNSSLHWSRACAGDYGARGREILCNLVLHGTLTIDMSSPLIPATDFVAGTGGF